MEMVKYAEVGLYNAIPCHQLLLVLGINCNFMFND